MFCLLKGIFYILLGSHLYITSASFTIKLIFSLDQITFINLNYSKKKKKTNQAYLILIYFYIIKIYLTYFCQTLYHQCQVVSNISGSRIKTGKENSYPRDLSVFSSKINKYLRVRLLQPLQEAILLRGTNTSKILQYKESQILTRYKLLKLQKKVNIKKIHFGTSFDQNKLIGND